MRETRHPAWCSDHEVTDEQINAAFHQTGGDGWQVLRFIADDGTCGFALLHDQHQPDPAAGDITVPEMLRLAAELCEQAEIAIRMGTRTGQDGAFHGNLAQGPEGGAS